MLNPFAGRAASPAPVKTGRAQQLLLGWSGGNRQDGFGFSGAASQGRAQAVTYDGDGPLITCAPTGSGKGRGVIIPNLGLWPGSAIVNDIKAELYHVTSRYRRETLGQQTILLDPFGIVPGRKSDGLNPLDLMSLPGSDMESDAQMLASLLSVGHETRDPFWTISASSLIAGLIAHIATLAPKERHLGHLRWFLYHHDLEMTLATMLDKDQVKSQMAREQFIAYITAPDRETRPSIRATACSYMSVLGSERVANCLQSSAFSLKDLYDGRPVTIYLVFPPDKLDSHKALLRLWVGTLLTTVMRRTMIPRQRTLFVLDEAAQLGELSILRQAITLLRGSGLQTWTFWQDLSQLRQLYPHDWQSIVNNAGVLQVFGINNFNMAREWGDLLGQSPETLDRMAREDTAVRRQGQGGVVCRRPDYLKDEGFAGRFDDNPRFALQAQVSRG
jgi:type IV secretion system protein VirD4